MPIVKNAATTLAQGVSQQAESQRYSSQATEQINGFSSTIKGLTKRPPTKFINKLSVDTGTSFAHTINRDTSEQYVVVVNPYSEITVNSFLASADSINIGTAVVVGDRIRFASYATESTLPGGLSTGVDYYVLTVTVNGATWDITVSRTSGGAIQKFGKASISKITLESVRGDDKRWVDGVYSVEFGSGHRLLAGDIVRIEGVKSGSNAEKIFDASRHYELRVPTKWFDYYDGVRTSSSTAQGASTMGVYALEQALKSGQVLDFGNGQTFTLDADAAVNDVTLSGDRTGNTGIPNDSWGYAPSPWPANTFLLGVPEASGAEASLSDNFGYEVDTRWQVDGDDDGYLLIGDSSNRVHWVPFRPGITTIGTGEGVATTGKCKTLQYNTGETFPADPWSVLKLVGSFVRLGGISKLDKAVRARVASANIANRTITLDRFVDFEDIYFDSRDYALAGSTGGTDEGTPITHNLNAYPYTYANPKWVYVAFWADTTTTSYSLGSNPRQIEDIEVSAAYVGSDSESGTFKVEKGGMHVFDADTGAEYPLDNHQGFGYVNSGNNPKKNLRAVTIADYTFLVNTSVPTKAKDDVKYAKNYEAFITARTADYGKTYKVKVGDKANPVDTIPIQSITINATYASAVTTGAFTVLPLPAALASGGTLTFPPDDPALSNVTITLTASALKDAISITGTSSAALTTGAKGTPNTAALSQTSLKSYADLPGVDLNGKTGIWACRIQAKTDDPKFNGTSIRLVQNWKWREDDYPLLPTSERGSSPVRIGEDAYPSTLTDFHKRFLGAAVVGGYAYFNDKVGIFYRDKELIVYVNFPWAKYKKNHNTLEERPTDATTVKDLVDAFANLGLVKDWEVVMLAPDNFQDTTTDGDGNVTKVAQLPSTLAATQDAAPYTKFHHLVVGAQGDQVTGTYTKAGTNGKQIPYSYLVGRNEDRDILKVYSSGKLVGSGMLTAGLRSPNAGDNFVRNYYTSKGGNVETGWQWDSNSSTTDARSVETGEYWYKTPKWTGKETQQTIGTERIAELLASDAKIVKGYWGTDINNHKSNGRLIQHKPVGAHQVAAAFVASEAGLGKESCLGMTYSPTNGGHLWDVNSSSILGLTKERKLHTQSWRVQQQGYTIALSAPDRDLFNITVEDDLGGQGLKLTFFEASETQDLPTVCRQGHVVKIIGDAREEADDYYLRFEADDSNNVDGLQQGRWVECVGYEQRYAFDKSTMPVALIRDFDENASPSFRLEPVEWADRAAGDDQSNPFPSFLGNPINDIFLFRNRLGFLSGENAIFSEAGEYYNFFRTTTAALLDTSPIDVQASTNKVSILRSATPYHEKLILFSDQTQFILDGEPFLSPRTVTLSPANEVVSIPGVNPVVAGGSMYFPFLRAGFSGIGELKPSTTEADVLESSDSTAHIPKYIAGNITKLVAATNEDVICAITDTTTEAVLYVYKYFQNSQNQKIQSAYSKYLFGSANDYIHDISFIANTLYLIINRGGTHYIESIRFEDAQKDVSTIAGGMMDYQVLLDHRTDTPTDSDNITANAVTLPANYKVTSTMKLVDEDGNQFGPSTTTGTNVFTVGNVPTTKKFYIGEPYSLEYTFSQPFLKREKATETGRYQLQRAHLEYANARTFTVDVIHNPKMAAPNKLTVTNKFEPSALQNELVSGSADLYAGFYTFSIQERNDRLQLKVTNASPYPSDLLSIDYESRVYSHASRWRA
jgi:hypothetical protein